VFFFPHFILGFFLDLILHEFRVFIIREKKPIGIEIQCGEHFAGFEIIIDDGFQMNIFENVQLWKFKI